MDRPESGSFFEKKELNKLFHRFAPLRQKRDSAPKARLRMQLPYRKLKEIFQILWTFCRFNVQRSLPAIAASILISPLFLFFEVESTYAQQNKFKLSSIEGNHVRRVPNETYDYFLSHLEQHADDVLNQDFPAGYPLYSAAQELEPSGAKCRESTELIELRKPKETIYFCDFNRHGHGPSWLFITITLGIIIHFNKATNTITRIPIVRQTTGF